MSTSSRPGLIRRLAGGTWRAVDLTRRFIVNVIFILLLVWLLSLMLSPSERLRDRTALVIAPQGMLVEQYSGDAASRALAAMLGQGVPEVQLRDVLRAIEAARDDDRIERIVLNTDGLGGVGFAAMREIAAALEDFRASGKQVVAWNAYPEQRQFYLAAQADEVYLHPAGGLLIEGIARYRPYYREALEDKLGVNVHLFRVGEYKSAAEPYIRDSASEEAREANLFWMNDIWQRMLAGLGERRGIDPAALAAMVDALPDQVEAAGGDLARMALDQGLVDELLTADQLRERMIERGVADEDTGSFRQVSMADYLGFVDRENRRPSRDPKVAIIVAQGPISFGEQPQGMVGGDSTSRLVRQAREDDDVKAVVLRVDSPGGGVYPSEQIRREIELTVAAGKPVVVSMANVAASGGYWISMNADEIHADPSTITGSIGIFGLFLSVPETLERIGVRVDGVGTTRFAGAFDPTRPLDAEVGRAIQSVIDHGYSDFIGRVARARGMSTEAVDEVARGRVWSGAQALELGLVDRLGGLREAVDRAAELAGVSEAFQTAYVEREPGAFERFLAGLGGNARVQAMVSWVGLGELFVGPQAQAMARDVAWLREHQGQPLRGVAHCFCEY